MYVQVPINTEDNNKTACDNFSIIDISVINIDSFIGNSPIHTFVRKRELLNCAILNSLPLLSM
jgi:hypothetical protein